MDHFSDASNVELLIWGSTFAINTASAFGVRRQLKSAKSKVGDIKPGSTGPRIWTNLALLGQFSGFILPQLIYWIATAYNGFRQPEWMKEHALPSPPDFLGVNGVAVGRVVGLLAVLAGTHFARTALKTLGDQYHAIGIREKPRLIDHGPFAYVRHPIYTGSVIVEVSFALAFWSYIPLYALLFAISGSVLKVPIEESTMVDDPELGDQYKRYKIKVPYRIIPYIW